MSMPVRQRLGNQTGFFKASFTKGKVAHVVEPGRPAFGAMRFVNYLGGSPRRSYSKYFFNPNMYFSSRFHVNSAMMIVTI